MQLVRSFLVGASLVVAALAQSKIGFTQVPTSVTGGVPTTLKWDGGDGSTVTITLKRGPATNLATVSIITGDATGNSFTWTPPKSLPDGDDYAFQINQGVSEVNYSGMFTFSGGSGTVSSATKAIASSKSLASETAASETAASETAASSQTAALSAAISATLSSVLSAIAPVNTTYIQTTIVPANVTTAIDVGTSAVGTAVTSGGTGIPISRNTTLSRASLTATRTATTSVPSSADASATGGSAGSSPSPAPANSAANLASPLAFVISAFVAIVYLG